MEIFSILLFFIFSLIILGILVYVSPLLSAFIMILIPVVLVYILPDEAMGFFSIMQFSYSGIQIFNLHILLLVWSAFIGIISYAEVLSWYLLRESAPVTKEGAPLATKEGASPVTKEGAPPATKEGASPVTKEGASPVTKEGASPVTKEGAPPVSKEGAPPVSKEGAPPVIKEAVPVAGEKPKTLIFKLNDFLQKLYKILKGEKIKLKP